ncbi:MAG TPA: hypothetical protein VMG60_08625 [Burkholderiaceae bacterium]|nr:hypothetical protein [Burkholderiaceae bacterium]
MPPFLRGFARAGIGCLLFTVTGCATLTGSSTQTIEVTTVDARDRPVRGMTCTLTHSPGTYVVDTPALNLEIRRSSSDLEIECRRGSQLAKGTVVPHGESSIAHSLIPGGSIATLVDYATGAMYTYPSPLRLRIGQHLRFETGNEARATVVADVGDPAAAGRSASPGSPAAKATPLANPTSSSPAARATTAPGRTDSNGSAATQ